MLGKFDLDKTYQYLLIFLAFLMPLTVSGANTIIVIICFLWLFSGDYNSKYNQIISSKLMIASIVFYFLHVLGMLWTEDLRWGLHILHKMWYFVLLFPILYTIVKKEYIKYYVNAFFLAILITEILSYLIWFEIIGPLKNALRSSNPTPFMTHVSYNPILAFAIYLVSYEILIHKNLTKIKLFFYSFFAITLSINMFITGGRAGQVMFFAMLSILIFQYLKFQKIKSLLLIILIIPGIFFSAYQASDLFNEKVNDTIHSILEYEDNKDSSVGLRITFNVNSWEIIKQNPIIGVGTGDFPTEYKKINLMNTPELPNTSNPHNMYSLVLVQLGFLGLISFLSIFYYQIKLSFSLTDRYFRDIAITMPILFLIIMLSDSYLLGHFTSLLYIFFSSFLYKDFEKS